MPPKTLIIEDDHFLSNILKSRLEKEGFTVFQAFDGDEGLESMRKDKFDLVLLDLIMPKISGFEVLQQISSDPALSGTPVIVASNLGQDSDVEKAKQFGATDYYVKVRTSIDQLTEMVKNVIAKSRPEVVEQTVAEAVPQEVVPEQPVQGTTAEQDPQITQQ